MTRRLLIGLLAITGVLAAAHELGVRWNASPSVPCGVYLKRMRPFERGDLVVVCLPEVVGRWARSRGYLGGGSCPGDTVRLGKWVAAVEDDRVEVRAKGILVNGRWLEGTWRVGHDSRGRPVPLVPESEMVLGPSEVWLHSGRGLRNLDSRIFGALDSSRVEGVMEPIWVVREK